MKKLFLFLACFIWSITVFSQYEFKKITTHNGLARDIIGSIGQDNDGLLYFGGGGLNIYDGNSIKVYTDLNTSGLGFNILAIVPVSTSKIILAAANNGLFIYDKIYEKIEKVNLLIKSVPVNLHILTMHDDNDGKIWIGTLNVGLYSIDKNVFEHWQKNTPIPCIKYNGFENYEINSICSSKDSIWVGTRYNGMLSLSKNTDVGITAIPSRYSLSSPNVWEIKVYGDSLYAGTENGLNIIDLKTKKNTVFFKTPADNALLNNIIRAICKDKSGTIWAGTQDDGLYSLKFTKENTLINHFKNSPTNSATLSINKILTLFNDKYDNLWIGTWNGGVNMLNLRYQQFINIRNKNKENDLSKNMVWCIAKEESAKYWLGTNGSGLCSFESGHDSFKEEFKSTSENSISAIYYDETSKLLWEGTWGNGLKIYSMPKREQILKMQLDNALFKNDRILSITKDRHGVIWIGTFNYGVFSIIMDDKKQPVRYFKHFKEFSKNKSLENADIRVIVPDENNVLWVGSFHSGLFKVTTNDQGEIFEVIPVNIFKNSQDELVQIRSLFLDSKRNLWIGLENGIVMLYDIQAESSKIIPQLKNRVGVAFAEDNKDNIWVAHYNGLTRFNIKNEKTRDFLTEICFYSLYYDTENNQLIASSNKGLFISTPSLFKEDPFYPEISFSNLKIFNKPIEPGEKIKDEFYLKKAINYTDTLILPYSQNAFSVDISSVSFNSQHKNQIYYQLENLENSWTHHTGANIIATYTNLAPGNYILKVKTANHDNTWNPDIRKLHIIILPPWWKTKLAFFGYIFITLLLIIFIFRFIRERIRFIHELKIEKIKKEQNDKLNDLKLTFFTNISHEIRTPLTLILGPIEDIMENEKPDTPKYNQLTLILKNAKILYELINQILDFRKVEKENTLLKVGKIKLNEFILQAIEHFEVQARQKNISLHVLIKNQNIELWADYDMLRKIIFNLLSNAIKFSPPKSDVQVTVESNIDSIFIKVKDNKTGISSKDLPHIFERFYQSDKNKVEGGSGIGLFLVKRMVEQHQGTINVNSSPGNGSEFILQFKNGKDHFRTEEIIEDVQDTVENEAPALLNTNIIQVDEQKTSLMIIDDNDDIRLYLKNSLADTYRIYDFNNAADGLKFTQKHDVSLIICDIMMPVMDGLEFCEKIKSDLKTSHIPVILLTAKTATETKIEGYEKGADDYITKPFSVKLVQTRIKNLIEQRENLKNNIKQLNLEPSNISPTSLDEQFIRKIISNIEENISNHEYSLDDLCHSMGLSHDNLYRKIKNLANCSATHFIRMIRLKRAAQLLENSEFTISEILFEVGFSNPSHFTKCFKQQFGISPTEYQKNNKRNK